MAEQIDGNLSLTWKAFLLEQVNHPKSRDEDWKIWEDPDVDSRDLPPQEAAYAVREREGKEAFDRYHRSLFRAHHEEDRDITSPSTLVEIAGEQDLDTEALASDLEEHRYRKAVGQEHLEGERELDLFGVPTILFDGTQPIFLKLAEGEWEGTDDLDLFYDIYDTAATRSYLLTVKKPSSAASRAPAQPRNSNGSQ